MSGRRHTADSNDPSPRRAGGSSRRRGETSSGSRAGALRGPSAGIVLYRGESASLEVLLVHPGGPWWRRQEKGAWSIPKGECMPDEEAYSAARREFAEELGVTPPAGEALPLGEIRQKAGKRVLAWALPGDLDASAVKSNTFTVEWPPRSGQFRKFPEVDRAQWFGLDAAREKINPAQEQLLDRLKAALA